MTYAALQTDKAAVSRRSSSRSDNEFGRQSVSSNQELLREFHVGEPLMREYISPLRSTGTGAAQIQRSSAGSAAATPASSGTVWHPGVAHNHLPSGRWLDVQDSPNSGGLEEAACWMMNPDLIYSTALHYYLHGLFLPQLHLIWYRHMGGADYDEDANLLAMIQEDSRVRAKLLSNVCAGASEGSFTLEDDDYDEEKFKQSFGAIDQVDWEVDAPGLDVHVWFQDRYEWHPVYPFYTQFSDDYLREDNCVHAAMVELKSEGAADFWMKGEPMYRCLT
jgi:hypothetical protein